MSFASHESATRQSAGDAITAEDIRAGGAKARMPVTPMRKSQASASSTPPP